MVVKSMSFTLIYGYALRFKLNFRHISIKASPISIMYVFLERLSCELCKGCPTLPIIS